MTANTADTLDCLRENRLLRGCAEEVLTRIEPLVSRLKVPGQQVLFRIGDPGDALFLVFAGAVRISTNHPEADEEIVAVVGPGEFFGDMALLDQEPHIVQAAAVEGGAVLGRVDRVDIEEILRLAPHVVPLNFVRTVHARIKESHRHFVEEVMRGKRLHHVGVMTGTIIHDFKNPLTAIRCACDMLESRDHDETHRRVADIIKRSVERMMGMTQELLDYTLGEDAPVKFEATPIHELIASLNEQCLADLPSQGIAVEKRIDYQGKVQIDVLRFERALVNIIKNAREAMPHGGRLRLAVYPSGEWLVFEIEDTGRGMRPEVAALIFEPFFTHGKPDGTGLGMPMARSVVNAHQGTIRVESEPGRGTKFEVKIPLARGNPVEVQS